MAATDRTRQKQWQESSRCSGGKAAAGAEAAEAAVGRQQQRGQQQDGNSSGGGGARRGLASCNARHTTLTAVASSLGLEKSSVLAQKSPELKSRISLAGRSTPSTVILLGRKPFEPFVHRACSCDCCARICSARRLRSSFRLSLFRLALWPPSPD